MFRLYAIRLYRHKPVKVKVKAKALSSERVKVFSKHRPGVVKL